jgi:hypothetical protein
MLTPDPFALPNRATLVEVSTVLIPAIPCPTALATRQIRPMTQS